MRTATFILGDQKAVTPSNVGAGYILRRVIRRAVRHGRKIGIEGAFLAKPADVVMGEYIKAYPEFEGKKDFIFEQLGAEEDKFLATLKKGEAEFEKLLPNLLKNPHKTIPGRVAFRLYDTFGFPIELTEELGREHGMTVDIDSFREAEKKHQEESALLKADSAIIRRFRRNIIRLRTCCTKRSNGCSGRKSRKRVRILRPNVSVSIFLFHAH